VSSSRASSYAHSGSNRERGRSRIVRAAARHELVDFVSREPSLEETFLAEYGTKKTAGPAEVAR